MVKLPEIMMMKYIFLFSMLCLNSICLFGQNWKNYTGTLKDSCSKNRVSLKLLFLEENYLVGSYRLGASPEDHSISGKISGDTVTLSSVHLSTNELEGFIVGNLIKDSTRLKANFYGIDNSLYGIFRLRESKTRNWTNVVKHNRGLVEFNSIGSALMKPIEVLSIDMERQGLSNLPDVFGKFKNLQSINLLGNKFETFPKVISKAISINELSLSSNGLLYIGPEIGELTKLEMLILNFNKLNELPKEMGNLKNLLYLDIRDNDLTSLPNEIMNLKKLQTLRIDGNKFSDEEIKRIKRLLPNCTVKIGYQRTDE